MRILAGLLLLVVGVAQAENLAVICTSGSAGASPATCQALKYDSPKPADLVRKGTSWRDFVLAPFSSLQPADTLDACTTTIARGTISPIPFTSADPCKSFAVLPASAFTTVPRIALSWSQELKNADGTALTGLAGFRIVYGTAANALTQTVELRDPSARAYTLLENLAYSTTYYVALKSFDSKGAESDKSNTVTATTAAKPSEPAPPTQPVPPVLSVVQQTAYRVESGRNDQYYLTAIGTVPVGTACLRGYQPALDYFLVPRSAVMLNAGIATRPRQIAAKCG